MTDPKVYWLFILPIVHQTLAIDYRAVLLNETITHYENEYLLFNVRQTSDEMHPYVFINQPITEADDLQLLMEAWRSDGLQFPFPDIPIRLCYLLENELVDSDNIMTKLSVLRIFNLHRRHCPIGNAQFRVAAYTPPQHFNLEKDLGCDVYHFRATLLKCDFVNLYLERCVVLIKADMKILIMADYCCNQIEEPTEAKNQEFEEVTTIKIKERLEIHVEI